jgi:5-methylthioadenosine/S-adenosylhomocysteine deaminase
MPSKESVDLVIEPRWVLPIAPANTVLTDHAVAVTEGRIVAVAPREQITASFEPRERVIRGDHALLPGFVNAHTRAATSLLRGLPVYGPRSQWLRETVRPIARTCMSPDFVREGTQLAMAEPLWDEYRSHPGISLYFAPHSAFGEGDQTLARVRRVADELDARVAIYLAPGEMPGGRRPLVRLNDLGLLGPGFTAVHPGSLDEAELDVAATTGICVVACQQSHLRLGGGLCPVWDLEARGITVGLGTDSAVSVGALDVLAEARMAALVTGLEVPNSSGAAGAGGWRGALGIRDGAAAYSRTGLESGLSNGSATAEIVLRMATLGGATALGMGTLVGSIETGKAADLVCFDLSTLPCQSPLRPADAIVFGATRDHVSDVWISGRAAVSNGHLLTFDEQELGALARRWAERISTGGIP